MATDSPGSENAAGELSDEAVTDFLSLLNELKATGCSLLVVGDAPSELFVRTSATLLGDPASLRYRLLATTDVSPRSLADRLPDAAESPRPLADTTTVVDYANSPRSTVPGASAAPGASADAPGAADRTAASMPDVRVTEPDVRIPEPDLGKFEAALAEEIEAFGGEMDAFGGEMDAFGERTRKLQPATLRVGVDSVNGLLDQHGVADVRDCLESVGDRVRARDGMAHFVLREPYGSERARALEPVVDAVIEVRSVDPDARGHDAQQRWHVPSRDLTIGWVRL